MKGKNCAAEHRAKISKANSGKMCSAEACATISKGKKGKKRGQYRGYYSKVLYRNYNIVLELNIPQPLY